MNSWSIEATEEIRRIQLQKKQELQQQQYVDATAELEEAEKEQELKDNAAKMMKKGAKDNSEFDLERAEIFNLHPAVDTRFSFAYFSSWPETLSLLLSSPIFL